MATPRSKESRLFYRSAQQRYGEAEVLLEAGHPTGAVYLAGYSIECMLKALVLSLVPPARSSAVLQTFRGSRAHDFHWLRFQYRLHGGAAFPREVNQHFLLSDEWSTDLRYSPMTLRQEKAEAFIDAAKAILRWGDGRLE
jgi:hypothetical protein